MKPFQETKDRKGGGASSNKLVSLKGKQAALKQVISKNTKNARELQKEHDDLVIKSQKYLRWKYYEVFHFYFAKPINEILSGVKNSVVLMFKDLLYWDNNKEFLRRYYTVEESEVRLRNYTNYYEEIQKEFYPKMPTIDQSKVLQKRMMKQQKLRYQRLKEEEKNQKDRENHCSDSDEDFESKNQKQRQKQLKNEEMNQLLCGMDDDSNESETRKLGEDGVNEKVSFNSMMKKFEENTDRISFETAEHDIYEPVFSSGENSVDDLSDQIEEMRRQRELVRETNGMNRSQCLLLSSYSDVNEFQDLLNEDVNPVASSCLRSTGKYRNNVGKILQKSNRIQQPPEDSQASNKGDTNLGTSTKIHHSSKNPKRGEPKESSKPQKLNSPSRIREALSLKSNSGSVNDKSSMSVNATSNQANVPRPINSASKKTMTTTTTTLSTSAIPRQSTEANQSNPLQKSKGESKESQKGKKSQKNQEQRNLSLREGKMSQGNPGQAKKMSKEQIGTNNFYSLIEKYQAHGKKHSEGDRQENFQKGKKDSEKIRKLTYDGTQNDSRGQETFIPCVPSSSPKHIRTKGRMLKESASDAALLENGGFFITTGNPDRKLSNTGTVPKDESKKGTSAHKKELQRGTFNTMSSKGLLLNSRDAPSILTVNFLKSPYDGGLSNGKESNKLSLKKTEGQGSDVRCITVPSSVISPPTTKKLVLERPGSTKNEKKGNSGKTGFGNQGVFGNWLEATAKHDVFSLRGSSKSTGMKNSKSSAHLEGVSTINMKQIGLGSNWPGGISISSSIHAQALLEMEKKKSQVKSGGVKKPGTKNTSKPSAKSSGINTSSKQRLKGSETSTLVNNSNNLSSCNGSVTPGNAQNLKKAKKDEPKNEIVIEEQQQPLFPGRSGFWTSRPVKASMTPGASSNKLQNFQGQEILAKSPQILKAKKKPDQKILEFRSISHGHEFHGVSSFPLEGNEKNSRDYTNLNNILTHLNQGTTVQRSIHTKDQEFPMNNQMGQRVWREHEGVDRNSWILERLSGIGPLERHSGTGTPDIAKQNLLQGRFSQPQAGKPGLIQPMKPVGSGSGSGETNDCYYMSGNGVSGNVPQKSQATKGTKLGKSATTVSLKLQNN